MKRLIPLLLLAMLAGCRKDKDGAYSEPFPIKPGHGFFTLCQGEPSSVGFVRYADGKVFSDIYLEQNGKYLDGKLVGGAAYKDHAYLIMKDSNLIEMVSLLDFKSIKQITLPYAPNKLLILPSGRAYVSTSSNTIYQLDISDLTVLDSVVAHSYVIDMTLNEGNIVLTRGANLSAFDTLTHKFTWHLNLPFYYQITQLVADIENRLWCFTPPVIGNMNSLLRIRPTPPPWEMEKIFYTPGTSSGTFFSRPFDINPGIAINPAGNTVYIRDRDILRSGINDTAAPDEPFIVKGDNGWISIMGIRPQNGEIYTVLRPDSPLQSETVTRYSPEGTALEEYETCANVVGFIFY
jgi:hypothetical protein